MPTGISISPELLAASQGRLRLGVLISSVKVSPVKDELLMQLQQVADRQKQLYTGTKPETISQIQALMQTYKALGLKLADYPGSNAALLKRVCGDKSLYQINSAVDANNLVSLASLRSVGSYDLSKLSGNILFRPGQLDEIYPGTTKRPLKLHRLPVLCDAAGPFGSPTSDSQRALITPETVHLMTVIFSFDGEEGLDDNLQQMADLLVRYSGADRNTLQMGIVKGGDMPLLLRDLPAVMPQPQVVAGGVAPAGSSFTPLFSTEAPATTPAAQPTP